MEEESAVPMDDDHAQREETDAKAQRQKLRCREWYEHRGRSLRKRKREEEEGVNTCSNSLEYDTCIQPGVFSPQEIETICAIFHSLQLKKEKPDMTGMFLAGVGALGIAGKLLENRSQITQTVQEFLKNFQSPGESTVVSATRVDGSSDSVSHQLSQMPPLHSQLSSSAVDVEGEKKDDECPDP